MLGLNRELQQVEDISAVLQRSLDEMFLVHSRCYDLCDFHQTPDTPASKPEEQVLCCILDIDGECIHCKYIRLPVVSPVAFLYFSSAFCVVESCLCCKPCRYLSV
jgi:hypothetical protein